MKSVPSLHTGRCSLSAITRSDIPVLRQILDDPETQRFLPELCKEFQTAESLQQFIVSFDKYLAQDEGLLWGIRKDDTLIGFMATMDIMIYPTLFYAMHPDFRDQGYMKESLRELVFYVQNINLCNTLMTEVYGENLASQRLLSTMGFVITSVRAGKFHYKKELCN